MSSIKQITRTLALAFTLTLVASPWLGLAHADGELDNGQDPPIAHYVGSISIDSVARVISFAVNVIL
ncbi:MAG: hypothetical protein KC591_13810 [Gemmatimonadetes bacterium]|nr:hypothetical protein [Gemmatimonadota bacterium]